MEIKHLEYFLRICEHKSFSKAAKSLYISQQGMSKVIKRLEDELQIKLFHRTATGINLTEYGEYIKEKAKELTSMAYDIKNELTLMQNQHRGELNIAMSFGVISALSMDFFSLFQSIYPNLKLNTTEYQDFFCEQAVLEETADIGFTIAPVNKTLFNSKTIIRDRMCILVNEQNPLSRKLEVKFSELKNEHFLMLNPNFKLHTNFVKKCKEAGFEPTISLTTMELILIHNLSRANKGIGVGVYFIGNDIANVRPIPFQDPTCTWEVCLITKKGRTISHSVKVFVDFVLSQYKDLSTI